MIHLHGVCKAIKNLIKTDALAMSDTGRKPRGAPVHPNLSIGLQRKSPTACLGNDRVCQFQATLAGRDWINACARTVGPRPKRMRKQGSLNNGRPTVNPPMLSRHADIPPLYSLNR